MGEVLGHLGLAADDIPAATLDAVRQSLEGDDLDPRALADRCSPWSTYGGNAKGYHTVARRRGRTVDLTDVDLDSLSPRQLAELADPKETY